MRRHVIALWGVLGVAATFVDAIVRLAMRAGIELAGELSLAHWLVLGILTIVMTYIEGHLALQRRFAPSVVARARAAAEHGRPLWAILAPLYAVSLIGAPPRVIVRAAFGITMIVVCVVVVRQLPAPWRGIIDAAVAAALAWGLVALLACLVAPAPVAASATRGVPAP